MGYHPLAQSAFADVLTSGEATLPRNLAALNTAATLSSGFLRLSYFTAKKTEAITQVRLPSGSIAAAATPTICRFGIYSLAANGDGTLLVAIANDTTLWAATNTEYLRSFTATFNKVAGTRYAAGWICVSAAAQPNIPGLNIMGGLAGAVPSALAASRGPRLFGQLGSQSDLPGSFTEAGLANVGVQMYAELVP